MPMVDICLSKESMGGFILIIDKLLDDTSAIQNLRRAKVSNPESHKSPGISGKQVGHK